MRRFLKITGMLGISAAAGYVVRLVLRDRRHDSPKIGDAWTSPERPPTPHVNGAAHKADVDAKHQGTSLDAPKKTSAAKASAAPATTSKNAETKSNSATRSAAKKPAKTTKATKATKKPPAN